jgi:flagellar biosynthetic protein FliP
MKRSAKTTALIVTTLSVLTAFVLAPESTSGAPEVNIRLEGADNLSPALQIVLLLTVLSLAPALIMMLTSFTRIVIVLSLLKQAMGTHQMPPGQIIAGLALFLTVVVMSPVWSKVHTDALAPYLKHEISQSEALARASNPVRAFMLRQTREKDILLFLNLTKQKRPNSPDDIPLSILIPSFMISELKTAFQIGFVLYLPFLVLDMVIASILLSMGMMMLPPIMISLPFKLLLFVLVDGWNLIVGSLVKSFA